MNWPASNRIGCDSASSKWITSGVSLRTTSIRAVRCCGRVSQSGRALGGNAQNAITGRARLAHQDVALVALELGKSRRLAPLDVGGALHDPRAACAARAGRAFVGQREAPGEAGVEQPVACPTVEIENARIGFDGDLH